MQKKAISLIFLGVILIGTVYSLCNKPQVLYHLAGTSLFFNVRDIQEALLEVESLKLKDVQFDVSKTFPPHKEVYTLKNIVPHFEYDASKEVESLTSNTIVKSGGKLDISVEFEYNFVDGAKIGSGKGEGKFTKQFQVTLTKKANYVTGQGLQWDCEFTDLALENMLFLKTTGNEMDMKTQTTFTSLLNQNLGANYECVKSQLETTLKQIQPKINDINSNQVKSLFGNSTYDWVGHRMGIDESLVGYSLSSMGESLQILGLPEEGISCYDISLFDKSQDIYFSVSKSLVENSYNFLSNNNMLFSSLDPVTWHIPNFYFTIRDLAFAMPKVTSGNSLDDQLTGSCNWNSGPAPVFNATSNGFDLNMKYSCTLKTKKDNQLVLSFLVKVYLHFVPEYDEVNSVQIVIKDSNFEGTEFQPSAQYAPVQNQQLLKYFVSLGAKSLIDQAVFGSGIIYLPTNMTNPSWTISEDLSTIFFYSQPNPTLIEEIFN